MDALKYVLTPDYAASNVGLVTAYIAGADDYYHYHLYLNNANTGVVDDDGTTYTVDGSGVVTVTAPGSDPATYPPVDFDAVGVTAVDDHTLTYTLTYDFPGFLSLLCYLPYRRPVRHQRRDHLQLRCLLSGRLRVSGDLGHEEEPRELRR